MEEDYQFRPFNELTTMGNGHGNIDKFCPVCGKHWNHGHGHEGCHTPTPIDGSIFGIVITIFTVLSYYKIKDFFKTSKTKRM